MDTPSADQRRAALQAKGRKRRRIALWSLPFLVYLMIVGIVMLFEESFIFFPMRYPEGEWEPAYLAYEDVNFQAADGTALHGWYIPHENPRAVILFSHGNAGNLSHRAGSLHALNTSVGVAVMIYDYRGYGRSQGKPNEEGMLRDARAARAWLAEREGIEPEEIVLMGRSLGGAVAVDLAQDGARGLVLESTFTSIPDMAAVHYPWLPFRGMIRNRFDSLAKIGNYQGPLLQTHGDADGIVPFELGKHLHDAANSPKRFLVLEGAEHNDPRTRECHAALIEFLDGLP